MDPNAPQSSDPITPSLPDISGSPFRTEPACFPGCILAVESGADPTPKRRTEEKKKISSRSSSPVRRIQKYGPAFHECSCQSASHQVRQPSGPDHQPRGQSARYPANLQASWCVWEQQCLNQGSSLGCPGAGLGLFLPNPSCTVCLSQCFREGAVWSKDHSSDCRNRQCNQLSQCIRAVVEKGTRNTAVRSNLRIMNIVLKIKLERTSKSVPTNP